MIAQDPVLSRREAGRRAVGRRLRRLPARRASRRRGRSGTTATATPCATRGSATTAAPEARQRRTRPRVPRCPARRTSSTPRPRSARVGQLRHGARRLHAARPGVLRPQAQRGQRRGQPRRLRPQPQLGLRRGRADRRRRGPRAAPPDDAQPARDPAVVDRRADARRPATRWAAPSAATTTPTASTTRPPGVVAARARGSGTCSPGPARCSRSGASTPCCATTTSSTAGRRTPDGRRTSRGSAPTAHEMSDAGAGSTTTCRCSACTSPAGPAADGSARSLLVLLNTGAGPRRRPAARPRRGPRPTTSCSTPPTSRPTPGSPRRRRAGPRSPLRRPQALAARR